MNNNPQKWQHPGGKLRELGAESLSDAELSAPNNFYYNAS
jgi:hypothetical protein